MRVLRQHQWLLVGLAALPLLLYAHSLANDFVGWDDGLLITENPWVQGLTWTNIRHAFTSYDPELYIPLTLLSYQLNYAIAGLSPWIYHLTNLLLHVGNVLLMFWIVGQLTQKKMAALAAALLFAVHPLHTEAVVWAAARKDVLSSVFLFLTLASFLRYRTTEKSGLPREARRAKWGWYVLSMVSFGLGLLSKVSILTAPLVLIMMDWQQERHGFRRSLRDALPFFSLSVLFGVVSLFGKIPQSMFISDKLLIGARATMLLLQKLLLPWGLTVFYPYTQPISVTTPDLFFSVVAVLLVTAVCFWTVRFSRWPLFAWVIFLLLVIPSFTNIAKGKNYLLDIYVTTDRYAYAASLGPLLLAGLFFDRMRTACSRGIACYAPTTALASVTIILSILAYRQSLTWKDSEALFRHAIAVSPNSYIAHQNLGTIIGERGDLDRALLEYAAALSIRPDGTTYYNIGQIMEYEGNTALAIEAYRKAVELSPWEKEAEERLRILEKGTQ